jgi:nucleotide-binding universal stress UspA family protein
LENAAMNKFANVPIVVPTDFFEESERALNFAMEIVTRASDVHVIHVATPIVVTEPVAVYAIVSDEERSEHLVAEFQKKHREAKYRDIHFNVRFGDPGSEIVSFAEKVKAGLIVMPSHGRTGLKHFLIGSVAERVVRLAKCPVLVLRGEP